MLRGFIYFCCIILITASAAAAGVTFSGSLSVADGGIQARQDWDNAEITQIQWWVTDNGDHWHYKYELTVARKDISHFIISVSPMFGSNANDYFGGTGPFESVEINTFTSQNGNPDLPAPIAWGLKFDDVTGTSATFEFNSIRLPMWGDFYSKNGNGSQMWNSALEAPNPNGPITSGSLNNHLLVPNTSVIPEPATMALLSFGLTALFLRRRRGVAKADAEAGSNLKTTKK